MPAEPIFAPAMATHESEPDPPGEEHESVRAALTTFGHRTVASRQEVAQLEQRLFSSEPSRAAVRPTRVAFGIGSAVTALGLAAAAFLFLPVQLVQEWRGSESSEGLGFGRALVVSQTGLELSSLNAVRDRVGAAARACGVIELDLMADRTGKVTSVRALGTAPNGDACLTKHLAGLMLVLDPDRGADERARARFMLE